MPTALEELNASAKTKSEAIVNLLDKIDGEKSPTADQLKTWNEELTGHETELKSLTAQITQAEQRNSLRQTAETAIQRSGQIVNPVAYGGAGGGNGKPVTTVPVKSYGETVTADTNFKTWLEQMAPHGSTLPQVRVSSPPVHLNSGVKALIYGGGSTTGAPLINIDYAGLLDPRGVFMRPLRILDLVTIVQTNSDTVEYPQVGTPTNAAAPVAEATASTGATGAKPESTLAFAPVTVPIQTIAHYLVATRQVLADAGMLREWIDQFLRYGLQEELEDQLISGNGTAPNLRGILNTVGIQTQTWATDELTTTRKARTAAILNGRVMPNAWVIHPTDWETIDLLKDAEERYHMGGPREVLTPRLWGIPVVESEAVTVGTALLGDFRFAVVFDRQQTAIYVSDSHSDFFTRNLITILGELRAAVGVTRPKAFVSVDLTAL